MTPITVSKEKMQAIESSGYGLNGYIGGLSRTTYYTPDGRVIKAVPDMRSYVRRDKNGNVIESGTRDANLDKGWFLQMPKEKKLFCPHCDMWHDNQVEVQTCEIQQRKMIEKYANQAKKEETDRTTDLEAQVAELKATVAKLLEAQGGSKSVNSSTQK